MSEQLTDAQMSDSSRGPGGPDNSMDDSEQWVLAPYVHEHPADPSAAMWGKHHARNPSMDEQFQMDDDDDGLFADAVDSATEMEDSAPSAHGDRGSTMLIDDASLNFTGWNNERDTTPRPALVAVVSMQIDK
jgi:hypothetical protein